MTTEESKEFLCPICLNLDFDHAPKKDPPCSLDEYLITTNFLDLRNSAASGDCLACQIICTGLDNMRESWDEAEESGMESEYLVDETQLGINLRRGHSLRITLGNVGSEQTVEFYTLSDEGKWQAESL